MENWARQDMSIQVVSQALCLMPATPVFTILLQVASWMPHPAPLLQTCQLLRACCMSKLDTACFTLWAWRHCECPCMLDTLSCRCRYFGDTLSETGQVQVRAFCSTGSHSTKMPLTPIYE